MATSETNPKSEYRNPKQTQRQTISNPEASKHRIRRRFVWNFVCFSYLKLFRISDFVLRIFVKKPVGPVAVSVFLSISWLLLALAPGHAQEETFYKGKTIRVLVGTTAGSLYDLWARAIAAHIGKHIPGNPETLVQNMPGAGHKIATNYLYNVAKPDGLTVIGSILPGMYMDQLVGRAEVKYDWAKFVWIGSPVKSESQMTMRADAPYKSIDAL
jgi:hypothetical protein